MNAVSIYSEKKWLNIYRVWCMMCVTCWYYTIKMFSILNLFIKNWGKIDLNWNWSWKEERKKQQQSGLYVCVCESSIFVLKIFFLENIHTSCLNFMCASFLYLKFFCFILMISVCVCICVPVQSFCVYFLIIYYNVNVCCVCEFGVC